jgi:hypothetical protein
VIVRCVEEKPGLSLGTEYVVLGVDVTPSSAMPVMFMIHLPGEHVTDWAYYEAQAFEVVDNSLPANWVFSVRETSYSLQPARWSRPFFWDHLLNEASPGERRQSWTEYRTERDRILSAASRPPGDRGSIVVRKLPRPRDAA